MGQPLRIEDSERVCLITSRTRNSELWFVNNRKLHQRIVAQLAKVRDRHGAKIYAFAIQGNHIHIIASFPGANRGEFMRDLNSSIPIILKHTTDYYPGGSLWGTRYGEQPLLLPSDIEDRVFYCALQAVQDGLCPRMSDYPGYNSFSDACGGISRKFRVVDWTEYHAKLRYDRNASILDFTDEFRLGYERIPGYEHLSRNDYQKEMLKKLEQRRQLILEQRKREGRGDFPPLSAILAIKPGSIPYKTKKSTRSSFRPLVLSACKEAREAYLRFYFTVRELYLAASIRFRSGDRSVEFPKGTYLPSMCRQFGFG